MDWEGAGSDRFDPLRALAENIGRPQWAGPLSKELREKHCEQLCMVLRGLLLDEDFTRSYSVELRATPPDWDFPFARTGNGRTVIIEINGGAK